MGAIQTVCAIGFLIWLLCKLADASEKRQEQKAAEAKAEAEEKFKRENPELWKHQELVKLEKERLAMQKELAERQIGQENSRRNASAVVATGRFLGWW